MHNKASIADPYRLHRTALLPVLPDATINIKKVFADVVQIGEEPFLAFLRQQGLASMWDDMLSRSQSTNQVSEVFINSLHQSRLAATGLYLLQKGRLTLIKGILDDAAIPHVVYKGAHTRERYYDEPALRPAVDVDVLVATCDKVAAIKAFKRQSFDFYAKAENISHEANLIKGAISVDLHWDILRPGRTRIPIVDTLLATRRDYGSHWGMNDEATLFIMLVHPVFVTYGTTPQAALMRLVDLALLLRKTEITWGKVLQLLDSTGLKTAAWITLKRLERLTGQNAPQLFTETLQPGVTRMKYLNYWVDKNLASQFMEHPFFVQLGFTLPAHDRPGDALRAINQARNLKNSQTSDLQSLMEIIKT